MSLKVLTEDKHKEAEGTKFIQKIFKGEIKEDTYYAYLCQLLPIYEILETRGKQLGLFEGLDGIERHAKIQEDVNELSGNYYMMPLFDETVKYMDYLKKLDKDALLAHIYVRHMGDMFGGQQLAKLVPGSAKMYEFDVDVMELISNFRGMLHDDLHTEANKAYQFNIDILRCFDDIVEPNPGLLI